MSQHKNIYMALCAAQQEFGQVTKTSTNPAFKSKYADLAEVANVVIPTLSKHGVAVLHYLTGEQLMIMRTEFVHAATETKVSCDVPLIVEKNNMQGMKSATTYAKRIGLESLSGIAPEDDDGNAAANAHPAQIINHKPTVTSQNQPMREPNQAGPTNINQLQPITQKHTFQSSQTQSASVPQRMTPEQIEEKRRQLLGDRIKNLAPQTQAEALKK